MGFIISQHRQSEERIAVLSAPSFDISKFGRLVQPLARLERQFTDRNVIRRDALRTEALAAFRATSSQQGATALGGHARAETVSADSVQITGVESTFHGATRTKLWGKSMDWAIYKGRQGY